MAPPSVTLPKNVETDSNVRMAPSLTLQLQRFRVDNNTELRYLDLELTDDADLTTPLFLGADLLHDSHIITANHSRFHARYARKGLATKLMFPDTTISGITNCQSGAWFYNIQGVFQVVFEAHSRQVQVKIVTSLVDMWKNDLRSPKLPAKMTVATHQLQRSLQPSLTDQISLSHLLAKCELGSLVTETNQDEPPSFKEVCDHHKLNTGSLDTIFQTEDSVLNPDSFWWLSKELLYRAQAFSKRCHVEDRYLTTSLIAFLKLVKSESKYQSDGIFASFLELISNYSSLITDPTKLKSFRSTWGIDEKQNALLCLTCEWLGKHMNLFNETIAKKVEAFKLEHVSRIGDLPSAQNLVVEVFPECMQLLIGYWIGLYGTRSADSNVLQENIQSKRRTKGGGAVLASGKRADHSYSSNNSKEDINGSFSAGGTSNRPHFDSQFSKRADHSYSSSPSPLPSGINSNQVDANNQPCRDDHTYVATEDSGVNNLPPNMREDHTYVSTKERKTKSATTGCMAAGPPASADPLVGGGLEEDHDYDALPYAKRFKPSEVMTKGEPYAIILDSTKYSFVQLILEFLNNVLISGVAHVVHTRLIHS